MVEDCLVTAVFIEEKDRILNIKNYKVIDV